MKRITIGGKEYTLTFSIMASLYNECTEAIMNDFLTAGKTYANVQNNDIDGALKAFVKNVADIPNQTVILLYASLLEYHGTRRGDGTIKSKDDALDLMCTYLAEDETKTMYDLYEELLNVIVEDNFFEKTGLQKRLEEMTKNEAKPKKKKSSKVGETS